MLLLRRQLLNHFAYPTTGDPTRTQPRDFSSISFRIHSTTQTAGAAEAEVPRPRARACARRARTQSAPDARSGRVRARARGEARGLRAKQRKEPPTSNRRGRLRRPECVVRAYSRRALHPDPQLHQNREERALPRGGDHFARARARRGRRNITRRCVARPRGQRLARGWARGVVVRVGVAGRSCC